RAARPGRAPLSRAAPLRAARPRYAPGANLLRAACCDPAGLVPAGASPTARAALGGGKVRATGRARCEAPLARTRTRRARSPRCALAPAPRARETPHREAWAAPGRA